MFRLTKTMTVLAAVLGLGGCAGAPASEQTAANETVQCTLEQPVGTHRSKRVCANADERAALQRDSQDKLTGLRRQSAAGSHPTGPSTGAR